MNGKVAKISFFHKRNKNRSLYKNILLKYFRECICLMNPFLDKLFTAMK